MGGKWLELLSEIAPGLKRVAIMFNPDTSPASAYMPSIETAARSLKVAPIIAPVHSDAQRSKRPSSPLGASREAALSSCRMYSWSRIARRSYRRRPETTYRQSFTYLPLSETAACSPTEPTGCRHFQFGRRQRDPRRQGGYRDDPNRLSAWLRSDRSRPSPSVEPAGWKHNRRHQFCPRIGSKETRSAAEARPKRQGHRPAGQPRQSKYILRGRPDAVPCKRGRLATRSHPGAQRIRARVSSYRI